MTALDAIPEAAYILAAMLAFTLCAFPARWRR